MDTTSARVESVNAAPASSAGKDIKPKPDLFDPEEYTLRKRLPPRLPKRKNDIYVSRKTDFKQQFARCQKLFDSGWNEVYIHGLGAAINRAVNLALQLKDKGMGTLDLAVHTSTVELTDDFEPETDDLEPESRSRNNSTVHIKVFRLKEFQMEKDATLEAVASTLKQKHHMKDSS
ncbi:ribonuclease P protein subunit p20-like [Liolophura sinensis]|uniref:ribonuclease P protein subunit p20-like n=1 Tax=Liolophura sinensis TaxID=3198878 RepID=UPI003158BB9D